LDEDRPLTLHLRTVSEATSRISYDLGLLATSPRETGVAFADSLQMKSALSQYKRMRGGMRVRSSVARAELNEGFVMESAVAMGGTGR
jgi:hypothetical protein